MDDEMNKLSYQRKKQQRGMSFIEVLVGLVILVTGILGAVAMQATAKQGSFDAMQRSLASSLAQDIIARMRANAPLINANLTLRAYARNDYDDPAVGVICNTVNTADGCLSAAMIANDRFEWGRALTGQDVMQGARPVGGLVGAAACIIQDAGDVNEYTVIVSWQARSATSDNAAQNCGVADSRNRRQVVVQAFIFNI